MAFNYNELVNLIPNFIEPQIRDQLKEKIDLRKQTIHSRELVCANSFLHSENIITILWGLDIYRRYFDSYGYSPQQLRNIDLDYKFIVPKMIQIAKTSNIPLIVYEALYNLSEFSKGSEQIKQFVELQGLEMFIQFLKSPYLIIINQAVRGIYNILSHHQQYRKNAQQLKMIPILIDTIDRNETLEKIDLSISALNMLCEEYPFQLKGQTQLLMKNVLNIFCKLIQKCQKLDKNNIIELCIYGLLIPIRQTTQSHRYLMETGFLTYFIHLIGDYKAGVSEKALEILGEIIIQGKCPEITQYILEQDFLAVIVKLLKVGKIQSSDYIFQILSKLSQEQKILDLIQNKEFIELLFLKLKTQQLTAIVDFLFDTIKSLTLQGLNFWIDQGLLGQLMDIIQLKDENKFEIIVVEKCLYLIIMILSKGKQEQSNIYAFELKRNNGINIFAKLQQQQYQGIAELSSMIQKYL